jgi:secretion/DNA translocation related TadE-like protein
MSPGPESTAAPRADEQPRCVRSPSGRATHDERGIATVWGVAWVVVCLTIGWLAVLATAVASAQHHLDGAADLAALSAAARLQRGGDACAVADAVAEDNSSQLADCELQGDDVVVRVRGRVTLPFGLSGDLTAAARAGP